VLPLYVSCARNEIINELASPTESQSRDFENCKNLRTDS